MYAEAGLDAAAIVAKVKDILPERKAQASNIVSVKSRQR
ncbi:hypothetical protein MET9862_02966 [Methylobacterium symbioticum]|uniref:Uncharacterized protein n=1 Tax=Methylobacterium symbioticum TaxID=2584084 RepID=A0A509EE41_9HYPH|nr:hypothetical protein MET9862_02966 [Methylobacterium symbioticum]